MQAFNDKLAAGQNILIDGATGTELERREVPMVKNGWNAAAAVTHPDVVREIHEDYIRLGAEVIITNTFSSSKSVLEFIGMDDQFEEINRRAVQLALEARDRQNAPHVKIAGGMATPRFGTVFPPYEISVKRHREQAEIYAAEGADFIVLEMMNDIDATKMMLDAVSETGLPIWMGISCEIDADGQVIMWIDEAPHATAAGKAEPLAQFLDEVPLDQVDVILIMHTQTEDVDAALDVLQSKWDGPIGVYAHSGKFETPNWRFIDVISPADYAANAARWVDKGVQIIGGCCGIGPEHIATLNAQLFKNQ